MKKMNESAWDKLSQHYQKSRRISLENYHYGAYAPGENQLRIIGDVTGLKILEIGCGGGQNSIVLKKQGACSVIGIDQSANQLAYANTLAKDLHVEVSFKKMDMEELDFKNHSFDLVVSSHAMNYASDLLKVLKECNRVLRENGRIVTCLSHPLWNVIGDSMANGDDVRIVDYFDGLDDIWDWEEAPGKSIATFQSKSWKLEHIINGLIDSGFIIEHIAEPKGYSEEELNSLPSDDIPYYDIPRPNIGFIKANRIVPSAIIVSAIKVKDVR